MQNQNVGQLAWALLEALKKDQGDLEAEDEVKENVQTDNMHGGFQEKGQAF